MTNLYNGGFNMPKVEIENRSAVAIHGLQPGATRKIDVDENGLPLDKNWRRRLHDSKIDGAIAKVEAKPKKKKTEDKGD